MSRFTVLIYSTILMMLDDKIILFFIENQFKQFLKENGSRCNFDPRKKSLEVFALMKDKPSMFLVWFILMGHNPKAESAMLNMLQAGDKDGQFLCQTLLTILREMPGHINLQTRLGITAEALTYIENVYWKHFDGMGIQEDKLLEGFTQVGVWKKPEEVLSF